MGKIHWRGLAAGALLLCAGPVAAQTVKASIEAWQRSDYERAVEIWRPLAEAGDADASFNLGQAYRLGRGVRLNLAAAQTWLERAASKNHVDAQTTLGLLLFENGDRAAGLRWLKLAAETGEPRAMLVLGTALFNGDGTTANPVLGYAYVSRAAAQGLAPAKSTLAQMDQVLPVEQRKKGVAIALEKARADRAEQKDSESAPASRQAARKEAEAQKPQAPKQAPKALSASPAARSGAWRIQLGAFSQRSSAESLFKRLSGSGPLAGRQQFLVSAGPVVRLQVGPFESRGAAAAACGTLSAKGQPCFPVAAR
jgi:TPR repeat protein